MGLRDLASAWIRANSPIPEVWQQFETQFADALRRKVGYSFMLGSRLTRTGSPYAAYCHAGELFTFVLTPRQAKQLGLSENVTRSAAGHVQHNHEPRPEPLIRIEEVSLDSQSLTWEDAISGSFKWSTSQPWLREMCLQVAIEPPGCGTTILWSYFGNVFPGTTTHRFSVSCRGLPPANANSFIGVLPLFVQICIMEEEKPQEFDPWHPAYGQHVHKVHEPYRSSIIGRIRTFRRQRHSGCRQGFHIFILDRSGGNGKLASTRPPTITPLPGSQNHRYRARDDWWFAGTLFADFLACVFASALTAFGFDRLLPFDTDSFGVLAVLDFDAFFAFSSFRLFNYIYCIERPSEDFTETFH